MDRLEVGKGVEVTRDFALFLRDERALVISDLHLGFEGALAEQGVSIPRFQRRVILERLGKMLDRVKAEKVIVAGDFKHEFSRNLTDEWIEVKQVLRFLRERVTPVLVRGNHDNYLATILGDLGLPLLERADVGEQDTAGGAGGEGDFGADLVGDAGHLVERDGGQVVALAGDGEHAGLLARPDGPPRGRTAAGPERSFGGMVSGGRGGFAARGDGAFLDRPPAEPGDGGGWSEGQAEQPQ